MHSMAPGCFQMNLSWASGSKLEVSHRLQLGSTPVDLCKSIEAKRLRIHSLGDNLDILVIRDHLSSVLGVQALKRNRNVEVYYT